MSPVIKRHSLLRRHPSLSRAAFSDHYQHVHGPLAAAQAGFRKFAYRYVQNHVEAELLHHAGSSFDGITMTFQVPRDDYQRGFFQHPDYANVRPDEERLFDIAATISLLGEQHIVVDRAEGGEKAIILFPKGDLTGKAEPVASVIANRSGVQRAIRNEFDVATASTLGIAAASSPYGRLWEIWFDTANDRQLACCDQHFLGVLALGQDLAVEPLAFAVREIVVFDDAAVVE